MKNLYNYITEKLKISNNTQIYNYFPETKEELREILEERLAKDKNADLNDIDVSKITDMVTITIKHGQERYGLFIDLDPHNIDISQWNVSNVKDMSYMFYDCKNFNCDLSNWDMCNVKKIKFMFKGCKNFNCDLNNWDVSNVKDMARIFYGCDSLKNKPSWYKY